jgi:ribosome-binding protein aMBF1 (putative translation factor)
MKEEQEKLLKYIGELFEERRLHRKKSENAKGGSLENDDITEAGRRIRKARERQGMTVDELAALADLSPLYVTAIEVGEADPYMTEIQSISRVLNVELAYLFEKK